MKTQKIKHYRLSVSRTFSTTHPQAGKETHFVYKIMTALFPKETLFPVECEKCGWKSWSHMAEGGGQIADTGDYGDIYCPKCGSVDLIDIAEDGFEYYRQNDFVWPKLHTIRGKYDRWLKIMDEVQAGRAVVDLYYWNGKPYGKGVKQVVFATLDKDSGCGVQKLDLIFGVNSPWIIDKNKISIQTLVLAKNDGLSLEDFKAWFKGADLSEPMAIIHFTPFRY